MKRIAPKRLEGFSALAASAPLKTETGKKERRSQKSRAMRHSSNTHSQWLKTRGLGAGILFLMISGCQLLEDVGGSQSAAPPEPKAAPERTKMCEDPRPKICTMRYAPVCAVMASGLITTYPSACNACADIAVSGWRAEPCEE